jgi:chromosome segregation ATPase
MARGITEKDVFSACDALVLAGERPTIERVRQKIGRGSPNTVSPMLDAWFKGLGRRLQDPGAFAPPSDVPDTVVQAAQHFWEVARAMARADVEQQVAERLLPMQAAVDEALHAQALASAERDVEAGRVGGLRAELAELASRLEGERIAHAATATRDEAAREKVATLADRLATMEAQLRETEERARAEGHAAQERATGAERRAAMEIENERTARARADKRAEAAEKRLEALQATSATQVEELVVMRTSLEHERQEVSRLREAASDADHQRQAVDAALVEARLGIERAETEAKTTQAAMAQLLPLLAEAKPKKTARGAKQTATHG